MSARSPQHSYVPLILAVALVSAVGCQTQFHHKEIHGSTTKPTGADGKSGTSEFHASVDDKDTIMGNTRVTSETMRYHPPKVYERTRVPFLYNREEGAPNRPMPWYQSLSAAGERIQLVERLNQQVLDTDEVFLDAIGTKNANLEVTLSYLEKALDAAKKEYDAARDRKANAESAVKGLRQGLSKTSLQENATAALNRLKAASPTQLEQEVMDEFNSAKKQEEIAQTVYLNANQLLEDAIRNNIGQVNQRFTVFNMRPAALVAAERNPVGYNVTERKFLDALDLNQAAMVAGAVIAPPVIALGIVDSIAKRVIKKDGDTELTYFSVPVPYDFSSEDGSQDSGKSGGNPASRGIHQKNRFQVMVSNNGKYEFHLNAKAGDVKSGKDSPIDYASTNQYTDVLGQAVASDNSVYAAAIAANRDVQIAKNLSQGGGSNNIPAPKVTSTIENDTVTLKAEATTPLTGDYIFVWTPPSYTEGGDPASTREEGTHKEQLIIPKDDRFGISKMKIVCRVAIFNTLGAPAEESVDGLPIPKATPATPDGAGDVKAVPEKALDGVDPSDIRYIWAVNVPTAGTTLPGISVTTKTTSDTITSTELSDIKTKNAGTSAPTVAAVQIQVHGRPAAPK